MHRSRISRETRSPRLGPPVNALTLISTPTRGHARTYLRVDLEKKNIHLVEKERGLESFCELVEEGSDVFNRLPPFWKTYCRVAWRKMKEK